MLKKTSLLSLLLLSSVIATNSFATTTTKAPLKISQEEYSDVYSGVKFQYLDLEDRLLILNNLLKSIELDYALLQYKEKVIGLSFKDLKAKAIAQENAASDIELTATQRKDSVARDSVAFKQAEKNMAFLDRMKILVAEFKDTHFGIGEIIPRPTIYTGLLAVEADGKIVISRINKKTISRVDALTGAGLAGISIGDEIVEIDGVSVKDKIDELKKYVSGSSEAFIESEAVYHLMVRNFAYPTKSSMTVKFASGAKYKIPFFANMTTQDMPRLDALTYFSKVGIELDLPNTGIDFDKESGKWSESGLSFTGYRPSIMSKNLKDLKEYMTDSGSVGMRTGYYIQKGKTYAVMQLLTFSTANLSLSQDKQQTFIDAIRDFAIETKESELPVILDLRNNNGGNASFPAKLLSVFTELGEYYPTPSRGLRMTSYSRNLNEPMFFQLLESEDVSFGLTYDDLRGLLDDAIDERKVYPPMYNATGVIQADLKVGGFNNKMVVLVGPDCVSACDMASSLFSYSKRAVLVGTHSNGTGAGYSTTDRLNTDWTDSLKQLTTSIPNFLFGKPHADIMRTVYEEDSVYELCSENKPTVADINYSTTMFDIESDNKGWLMKAVEVLNK